MVPLLRRPRLGAAAAAGVLLALVAGCASQDIRPIKDEAEFQTAVRGSDKPVVLDFFKGGCPACGALDPMMNKLAEEYRGRVVFARFELMKPYFAVTSEALKKKYDVSMYPTVILFVGGQEKKRWVLDYNEADYHKVLDEVAGPPPAPGGPKATG